jgi:hypothetical protein
MAPHRVPYPVVPEVQCGLPPENTDRNNRGQLIDMLQCSAIEKRSFQARGNSTATNEFEPFERRFIESFIECSSTYVYAVAIYVEYQVRVPVNL